MPIEHRPGNTPVGPVDCHAHVFTSELRVVEDARYRPSAEAPLAAYLAILDEQAMAGGVLVQPSFLGTDNTYLLDALAGHPERLRGVAVVDSDIPADDLVALRTTGIRGVRFNLIGRNPPDFASHAWQNHIRRIAGAGLHVEIQCEGAAWNHVLPPIQRTGAVVVIDHFGRPTSHEPMQCVGFAAVLAAARDPSVWVKLSAPYRFPATSEAAARALLSAAGPARLLWGSDWPWTQHPEITLYSDQKARLASWVPDAKVRRSIFEDNPRRLYWR